MYDEIPDVEEPKQYSLIQFNGAPLVEICNGEDFDVKMQYPILRMQWAESHCYLRKEAYECLCEAKSYLPAGMKFRIWDAWRPFKLQEELYNKYAADIIRQYGLENASQSEQSRVVRSYVSEPRRDVKLPPVHTTGGAIDLTLIGPDGRELDMGTEFDAFSETTRTNYYELHDENRIVRNNRRILYNVMVKAGFTNLPSEWWHYDFGDRFWAYYRKQPAIYDGIFERE